MTKKPQRPVLPFAESLKGLKAKPTHIKYLRFPNYRNLAFGAKLLFEFPITVLLGRNGTNKSSVLHALYGAPAGNTVGEFWFETSVDAIPQTNDHNVKQSVVHAYFDSAGDLVECLKARAPRPKSDPDYWEAAKPSSRYGFTPGSPRRSPIAIDLLHLDFRAELPAFDKYFYFPDSAHLRRRKEYWRAKGTLRRDYRKQDYLRNRSGRLKHKLEEEGVALTEQEIEVLRYILERNYTAGTVLRHSLYHGHDGWTVVFKTDAHSNGYSEAFAGSGESAATLLVHKVLKAPQRSLILLDEPETSLHPRAQRRVLEFLAHQALVNDHQIVMATHSIDLCRGMPQEAIRVLERPEEGRVVVSTSYSAREALHEIGAPEAQQTILVEDERAKEIVVAALKMVSTYAAKEFHVSVREGGTSRIYNDILSYATAGVADVHVVFDGDQRPTKTVPAPGDSPQGLPQLMKLIGELTKGNDKHGPHLDIATPKQATKFIEFLRTRVHYLPAVYPEELVWSDEVAQQIGGLAQACSALPFKERLRFVAEKTVGFNSDTVFALMLNRFLLSDSAHQQELTNTISAIRKAYP